MKVLIDTQCWLWMAAAPERLSAAARELIESTEHDLYLSAASAWEISIKHSLGKLRLPEEPVTFVPTRMVTLRTIPLPVEHHHALRVSTLPKHHRDPFDRLIVAQALEEEMTLVSADRVMSSYDVQLVPA